MARHGVYIFDGDGEGGTLFGGRGFTEATGIANILFDPDTYKLRIVMDDGREFFTGSLRGEKGEQGDGYNASVIQGLKDYADDAVYVSDIDTQAAFGLLLNAFRQHLWEDIVCEEGTVTLSNTLEFPFNDSQDTVALATRQRDTSYVVIADVTSATGNPGEVVISDKQVNGFKIGYSGGAASVTVKYYVIGGFDA